MLVGKNEDIFQKSVKNLTAIFYQQPKTQSIRMFCTVFFTHLSAP